MKMDLNKIIELFKSIKDNPTVIIGIVFASIGTIASGSYYVITKANEINSIITNYDETAGQASKAMREVEYLKERVNSQAETIMKLQEKAGDGYMLAREAKVIADSTQKESRSGIAGIKSELDIQNNSLRSEMQAIRRATVNPLGK
jgi:ABC-type phosphate transport system auxiliary subunit